MDSSTPSSIPPSYVPARWHCTLAIDPNTQETGIGFTQADGSVIRLRLSVNDARLLAESLVDFLEVYDGVAAPTETRHQCPLMSDQVLAELSDIARSLRLLCK